MEHRKGPLSQKFSLEREVRAGTLRGQAAQLGPSCKLEEGQGDGKLSREQRIFRQWLAIRNREQDRKNKWDGESSDLIRATMASIPTHSFLPGAER